MKLLKKLKTAYQMGAGAAYYYHGGHCFSEKHLARDEDPEQYIDQSKRTLPTSAKQYSASRRNRIYE
jgi:hypothetical protein